MSADAQAILQVEKLSFSYDGRPVFEDANFAVAWGDMVGIVGGNGSGKTTLVKLLLGLLRPDS
jgi:ABC-type Mn2+/Zn2+ transport system ATPase subunit